MDRSYVKGLLSAYRDTPRFADGRIDFHGCARVPVVNVVVLRGKELLLLRRSQMVGSYRGAWHVIGGHLDEPVGVEEKALGELEEETGIGLGEVASIACAEPFEVRDASLGRCWLVHPVLVELKGPVEVRLDWEHTAFEWVRRGDVKKYEVIPGLFRSLEALSSLLPDE